MTREEYIGKITAEVKELFARKEIVVGYAHTPNSVRGTVVVVKDGPGLQYGWSLFKKGDRYNKYVGIHKALSRIGCICNAYGPQSGCEHCFPGIARHALGDTIDKTFKRAETYFAGKPKPEEGHG